MVELSIVLVILGLLVGGVLAGKSLIHAAELRSVGTEYNRYVTAAQSFRDKYFALPGDMTNATSFWGKDNATCPTQPGTAASPGTCNGNGNGRVGDSTAERWRFWQQLAFAGLIEGSYTGVAGSGGAVHAVIGENVPASKFNSVGWSPVWLGSYTASPASLAVGDYGNTFYAGAASPTVHTNQAAFTPEEAWNLDTKLDDGMPGTGRLVPTPYHYCSTNLTGAGNTDLTVPYALSTTTKQCALVFRRVF